MIHLTDVRLSYDVGGESQTNILNGVDFHVPPGVYAVLIGANGSGKTTIAKIIKGILTPDSGTVTVAGKTLGADDLSEDVGLVFSNPENQIVSTIVEEDIAFGLENRGVKTREMKRRVAGIIERLHLKALSKRLPHTLSGGEQQRLVIAGVLVMETKILILDEATSMLDSDGRRDILQLIHDLNKKEGITVLSITHSLVEAVLADIVFILDGGKIVFSGTPGRLLRDDDILKRYSIDLPEFLVVIRGLLESGIEVPDKNLGVEMIVDVLEHRYNGG